ncbi:MAG: hypothetical protein ACREVL_05175 [Solimonas sp.]
MRQGLLMLAAIVLIAFGGPARAEPACGSDTSSDPVVAMGKDVWLNGTCKSFLPCRLVLEQFHGCQAAEGFLSSLGAQQGQPLTEGQVEDALFRTTGKSSGFEVCLRNFDAGGCKRYLGIGGGSDGSGPEAPPPAAPASGAPSEKKPMSQNAAIVARQRVRDLDSNAHTAVGVIERACRAGADECRSTLESMVDPVIRTADELNANPEYLAHFPPYSPGSIEYAGRLGWTWQNGQWVFGGARQASSNTSTLGAYLLSVDECRKLHDRLDQEVKATPNREPVELSFFEAECVLQLPDFQAAVARWREGAKEVLLPLAAADTPQQASAGGGAEPAQEPVQEQVASDALEAWNEEVVAEDSGEARQIARRFDLPGGCYLYVYTFEDGEDFKPEVSWSGPCVAGEPVNGIGDFSLGGDVPYGDDYQAARVVNGRLEGGPYLEQTEHSFSLHSYAGGCLAKDEYLGRTWDDMLEEEETYRQWAKTGVKGYQGDYKGYITGKYVLNRTHKGVKYYRHESETPGELSTDQADGRCVAAFAKLL